MEKDLPLNNFVKKHMDHLHRPATHADRKRSFKHDHKKSIKDGLRDYNNQRGRNYD